MTSRLCSVGQRCPPVSGEGSGQGGMLMSDSHYCRAVTTSTSRIHPSPHTGRTSRQTRRPHGGGGPLNYSQHRRATVEKEMSPCPDERQSIGDNLPWSPLTTHGNHDGAYSSPGPTRGNLTQFIPITL
ncbi:hypothetical protein PoB_005293600 [Plakobranchus ocellatus]|uniref:Uncharacterized protein n=1 Tax=Plakobranchus ocellatus TaxID=259542 RepID=A0AAV4C4Z5_9GAST|nr:hypothetical protein PoB_005293600 [Plakobranchus ocellatus]